MKLKIFTLAFSGLLAMGVNSASAQQWCATDEHAAEMAVQFPKEHAERLKTEAQIQEYLANPQNFAAQRQQNTPYIIPVVVHVITENGTGGPSKATIEGAIKQMNDDFRRTNSDTANTRQIFKSIAADAEVEFRLATIDPNGNCTEGIVRKASAYTNSANPRDLVKTVSYWPRNKYFNIWLVNSISAGSNQGTVLGYAQFPGNGPANTYGFVSRIDAFVSGDRTATHEVGHCLNVYHTFQGGCGSNCSNSGDQVCDTPPTSDPTYGCSQTQNTCSNDMVGGGFSSDVPDQIENYMSYDACTNMFTQGQKARMHASFANYTFLQELTSASNAIATGIVAPPTQVCAPVALFGANKTLICQGGSVFFSDNSYNAEQDSTWEWNWTFPGGTPSTSTDQNPTVVYNTPGVYSATLVVSSAAGSNSFSRNNYIRVVSTSGITAPFSEGVEVPTFPIVDAGNPDVNWTIENNSTNTWARYPIAGPQGSTAALRIDNRFIATGTKNSIISPSIDMTNANAASITFDLAYARNANSQSDQLRVYVSTDCGNTWSIRYAKTGAALATNGGALVNGFIPNVNEWSNVSVNLSPSHLTSSLRVKIEVESGQANPVYIDNINIGGLVGMEEFISESSLNLYPNPATDAVVVTFDVKKPTSISCQVLDVLGREVISIAPKNLEPGLAEIPVSLQGLSSGLYLVKLRDGQSVVTRKLLVK